MSTARLRIAHIGLGDIARKAYLPLTTAHPGITPLLCTRNERVLEELAQQYRIKDTLTSIDALIASRPDGAMIHSSTDEWLEVVRKKKHSFHSSAWDLRSHWMCEEILVRVSGN
jgi:virulence factor